MIQAILGGVAEAALQFGTILTNAFEAVSGMFVTTGAEGAMSLTLLGTVLVIAIGATVVTFGIRLVLRLINRIRVAA